MRCSDRYAHWWIDHLSACSGEWSVWRWGKRCKRCVAVINIPSRELVRSTFFVSPGKIGPGMRTLKALWGCCYLMFFQVYWCSHRFCHLEHLLCWLRGFSARVHVFRLLAAFNLGAVGNQWCFSFFGLEVWCMPASGLRAGLTGYCQKMVAATANQVESQHRRNSPRISCKTINGLIARFNSSYGDSFDISSLANILMLLILQRQKSL